VRGGDLARQATSGTFGCRDLQGRFSEERVAENARDPQVKMIEVKLSQGAEGGTGAAPLEFTDHVGSPVQEGLLIVRNTLVGLNLRERVRIGCAGKVVSAFDIARMLALGADRCNPARGFMFALGCIQAQTCHTGQCPTGVTTQDPLRQRALVVPDKAERVLRFHQGTLQALRELTQAAGLMHPGEIRATRIVRRTPDGVRLLSESLRLLEPGELLAALAGQAPWPSAVLRQYWPRASARSFGLM
jgi:glutamate synthase domain-containing protein 2